MEMDAGMRRGRRDPETLRVGDTVDCWRAEALEPGKRLLLAAEMKLPDRAWLEFVVETAENGAVIRQTAIFDPVGLWGLAYWCIVWLCTPSRKRDPNEHGDIPRSSYCATTSGRDRINQTDPQTLRRYLRVSPHPIHMRIWPGATASNATMVVGGRRLIGVPTKL